MRLIQCVRCTSQPAAAAAAAAAVAVLVWVLVLVGLVWVLVPVGAEYDRRVAKYLGTVPVETEGQLGGACGRVKHIYSLYNSIQ